MMMCTFVVVARYQPMATDYHVDVVERGEKIMVPLQPQEFPRPILGFIAH